MSIAAAAIAEAPTNQAPGNAAASSVPAKRRTIAAADTPLVPEAR